MLKPQVLGLNVEHFAVEPRGGGEPQRPSSGLVERPDDDARTAGQLLVALEPAQLNLVAHLRHRQAEACDEVDGLDSKLLRIVLLRSSEIKTFDRPPPFRVERPDDDRTTAVEIFAGLRLLRQTMRMQPSMQHNVWAPTRSSVGVTCSA